MRESMRTAQLTATLGCAALFLLVLPAVALPKDLKEIEARGTIRALVSADEQPEMFALAVGSANPGIEREILDRFARAHGLKIDVVTVPNFEQIIPDLLKGDGDLIIGIIDTESRRRQIAFTIETLPGRHLVVNRKPAAAISTVDAMKRARFGVIQGTSWAEAAAAAGVAASNTVQFPDLPGVLGALESGKVAATVMSAPDFALARRRDPALQAGTFIGAPTSAAWGIKKTDGALVDALNDHIFTLKGSMAWGQLVAKYFTADALELFRQARRPQ
jgi:ABC-type amino acid transport substrate-binding protein